MKKFLFFFCLVFLFHNISHAQTKETITTVGSVTYFFYDYDSLDKDFIKNCEDVLFSLPSGRTTTINPWTIIKLEAENYILYPNRSWREVNNITSIHIGYQKNNFDMVTLVAVVDFTSILKRDTYKSKEIMQIFDGIIKSTQKEYLLLEVTRKDDGTISITPKNKK